MILIPNSVQNYYIFLKQTNKRNKNMYLLIFFKIKSGYSKFLKEFRCKICKFHFFFVPLQSQKKNADMAQLVEQRIRNAWVTSSSLVIGSLVKEGYITTICCLCSLFYFAVIAQLVEQRLPKPQVTGSSPAYRS